MLSVTDESFFSRRLEAHFQAFLQVLWFKVLANSGCIFTTSTCQEAIMSSVTDKSFILSVTDKSFLSRSPFPVFLQVL